jgi:hypothetical protein
MLLIPMLNADMKCAIQVLSVKEKRSITPEFMGKVSAMRMGQTVKYIDGEYKVLVGDFQNKEEASSHLPEVREKVSRDAFVIMVTREPRLKAEAKMQQMMVLAQAKLLQASKTETSVREPEKPVETKEEKVDIVDVPGPKEKVIIKTKETKTVVAMKDETKTEEIFCKPTKRALREAEISQALSFYRNSSYYGFNEGI